jgi:hypothetical protein
LANAEKILAKMRRNPCNWRIEDLETVADRCGIIYRQNGTSHVLFGRPALMTKISVPAARPIKAVYIRHLVAFVDEAQEADRK